MRAGPQGVRPLGTVGGLAAALDDALRAHGGTWIAWVGPHAHDELRPETTGLAYPIRAVRLKEREVSHYYAGFSNQVLWPLCHMFPSRCRIQQNYWTAYRAANERFAAVVQASVAPGDLVWIHDFHLCLVPGLLRSAGVPARLGVFWHIPFPPPTVFGILRWREELLRGFERFLERQPEWRRRVCLVQVTVPSRDRVPEYRDLKRAVDECVGRIAGRFTYEGRSPLRYLYTALSREQLVAYYAAADVALVTPLRDGMNLVAKEYVASRAGAPGVLVLSEFAGAATELREAVLVNPYDPEAIRHRIAVPVSITPAQQT